MGKCLHTFLWVAALALTLSSCKDDMYDNSPDEPLILSLDKIVVDLREQTVSVGVTARDAGWTMTGSESWCTVNPASGEKGITRITVAFASNDPAQVENALPRKTVFAFRSGDYEKTVSVEQLINRIEPNQNPDAGINRAIYDELVDWYYNGEVNPQTTPGDFNQGYHDFYFNYLSNLERNTFDKYEWVWSSYNETHTRSYIERNPVGTAVGTTPPLNYGMEFDLNEFNGRLVGRILYVEPGSPAARAGLSRGEWFWKVNDTELDVRPTDVSGFRFNYQRFIDTLVHPLPTESPRLGMLSFRSANQQFSDEGRTVTLSPSNHRSNPILAAQVIENRLTQNDPITGYTGYMMLNSFDGAYRNEVIEKFRTLFSNRPAGQELSAFILDLRYNKSGSVEMAELLGNLLVGDTEGVVGKTFARYEFNRGSSVAAGLSKTVAFAPHEYGIGVPTVYILTSPHTAGASELLINALRGLDQSVVKLVVIGGVTQGLAAGMVKRTVSLGDEWEYSAWILAFRCFNDAGESDYIYGFVPNGGEVDEWQRGDNIKWSPTWEWKGRTGSNEDPILKRAMDIITGREYMPAGDVVNASRHSRGSLPRDFCFPTNMTMSIDNLK